MNGEGYRPAAVLADRAYDANSLRAYLAGIGAEAVIPSTRSRKNQILHNPLIYKLHNRVERCFNKLKHFRRFATRFDRLAHHYLAFVHIAASISGSGECRFVLGQDRLCAGIV